MRELLLFLCTVQLSCMNANAQPATDVVRARVIELVDASGQVRAQLKVEDSGEAVFRLRDSKGEIRVKLGASDTGSGLLLNNGKTEPGIHALASDEGTTLKLRNPDGKEQVLQP